VETDVNKTIRKTKNRWEDDIRNDMKKPKIKSWTSCIQVLKIGNYMLRRPKHSTIEVVVPEVEEEFISKSFYLLDSSRN
jgi:hypothetical protein